MKCPRCGVRVFVVQDAAGRRFLVTTATGCTGCYCPRHT